MNPPSRSLPCLKLICNASFSIASFCLLCSITMNHADVRFVDMQQRFLMLHGPSEASELALQAPCAAAEYGNFQQRRPGV